MSSKTTAQVTILADMKYMNMYMYTYRLLSCFRSGFEFDEMFDSEGQSTLWLTWAPAFALDFRAWNLHA